MNRLSSNSVVRGLMRTPVRVLVIFFVLTATAQPVRSDDHANEFFEKRIRPVLVRHCYKCHSIGTQSPKGDLLLDTRDGIRRGGESGPAVVPNQVAESLLIDAIRYESLEMPPAERLPDAVIADFVRWIELGAPDPRDVPESSGDEGSWQAILKARRDIWSLQPVQPTEPPAIDDAPWSDHAVDRFIFAKLRDAGLRPAPIADRHALIRRLSFAVTGLPPSPQQVQEFVDDPSPEAWETLVDEMLSSPHFGERWARHWMDIVRFSETYGHEWNFEIRGAWRYRDYLIRALNQDVAYDQLIREHIAGDLLTEPRWDAEQQVNESLTATAFYRFGEVGHDDCLEFREISLDVIDNQIDTLTKAFQAMTVSCARCHDHKLDAVSMRDYYALSGILSSTRYVARTIDAPDVNDDIKAQLADLKAKIRAELAEQWTREVDQTADYLLAAGQSQPAAATETSLNAERLSKWRTALDEVATAELNVDHPLYPWQQMIHSTTAAKWLELKTKYESEQQERAEFNATNFIPFGDFRGGSAEENDSSENGWHTDGLGTCDAWCLSGDFSVTDDGERVVQKLLPAGFYTHRLSNRLNGALRSPMLPKTKKFLSVEVLGSGDSALRTIHDNCHLNVAVSLLTADGPNWITLPTANEYADSRSYAALVTRFSNQYYPKYNTPEKVDPNNIRSYFGVTRAVLHDCSEPPKKDLTHFAALFDEPAVDNRRDFAERYAHTIRKAVSAWAEDKATDADIRWINWLLKNELLSTSVDATPRLEELVTEYREIEARIPPPKIINGMVDLDQGFDVPLKLRGNAFDLGERVPRRYLEVLTGSTEPLAVHGSGRLELAEWIASKNNPLTARVMVNRVWHHLFGNGIVRTTDDFGSIGEPPSHPELLDYLADRFVQEGWSIKKLIRSMLLTQTFRMSSRSSAEAMQLDPQNRLLHHYPLRRLDAECIRDSILVVSSRLEPKLYGESIDPWRSEERLDRRLFRGPLDGDGRRSIYLKVTLTEEPPFLSTFNLPEAKVTRGRRDVTSVPAQALTLLNDPFVSQQADFWAARLVSESGSVSQRVESMFLQAIGRPATQEELDRFVSLADRLAALREVPSEELLTNQELWKDVAHALFNVKEFIYVR